MPYLVLARRWRPLKFAELIGQPHVAKTILNGLRLGRVAHAYLFSGPRGVGKTTTARLVARSLNCHNPEEGEPCGSCPSCIAVSESRSMDIIEIDAASNRGIEEIRQLRDGVRYAPIEGRFKIYIIDEVHMLTQEAFNALLKTLEEPPEHAYFCLATTEPQKVPATILSRCQRFDFRRVPLGDIRAHLEKICRAENLEYDSGALDIVARRADGSVRDALSLLDQVVAFSGGSVKRQDAVDVVGEIRLDLFFQALDLVESGSAAAALDLAGELASSGADPQDFILGLQGHILTVLNGKVAGVERLDVPDEFRERFGHFADSLGEGDLIRLLQFCTEAETDLRRRFNPLVRLQLLLLKFASFDRSIRLQELLEKLQSAGGDPPGKAPPPGRAGGTAATSAQAGATPAGGVGTGKRRPVQTPQPPSPPVADPLEVARSSWDSVFARVAQQHNSAGNMLRCSGWPAAFSDGVLTIHFSSSHLVDTAYRYRDTIFAEFRRLVGDVEIRLEVGDVPDRTPAGGNGADVGEDEAARLLRERFGAEPVN